MSKRVTRDGSPPPGRRTCPKCGDEAIRTIAVPWYPELEYLFCDKCQYLWTIVRASKHKRSE